MLGLLFVAMLILLLVILPLKSEALNVVLAGGTGPVGRTLAPRLKEHQVTVLARNAFLAAAPNRVTEQFGYFGKGLLERNPHVTLRDWDGGDLLDIVGQDWIGWQQDCLTKADVVVHLTGGFTEQRVMATERLIRESFSCNKLQALHVAVNPTDKDVALVEPAVGQTFKMKRIQECEDMVKSNCPHHKCLRVEANRVDDLCDEIEQVIEAWAKEKAGVAE